MSIDSAYILFVNILIIRVTELCYTNDHNDKRCKNKTEAKYTFLEAVCHTVK